MSGTWSQLEHPGSLCSSTRLRHDVERVILEEQAGQGRTSLGHPGVAWRKHFEKADQMDPRAVSVFSASTPDGPDEPVERVLRAIEVTAFHRFLRLGDLGVRGTELTPRARTRRAGRASPGATGRGLARGPFSPGRGLRVAIPGETQPLSFRHHLVEPLRDLRFGHRADETRHDLAPDRIHP